MQGVDLRCAALIALASGISAPGIAAAAPTAVSSPASTSADQQVRSRMATEIIEFIDPSDLAVATEVRGWEVGTRSVLQRDPGITKLNQEHPGLIDAAIAAGRGNATEYLRKVVANMKSKKAEILARRLSIAELTEVRAFVSSAAGQRFYRRLHAGSDVHAITEDVLDRSETSGTKVITRENANQLLGSTMKKAAAQTSSEDALAIMKFQQTAAAKQFGAASDEAVQAVLEVANNPDPEFLSKQQDLLISAMIAFAEKPSSKKP